MNTTKQKKYYRPTTTDEVVKRIAGVTEASLMWLKIDIAEKFMVRMKGSKRAKLLMNSVHFWNWFNKLWEIHDKNILYDMKEEEWDTCNECWYGDQQYTKWEEGKWCYMPPHSAKEVINLS